MQLFLHLLKRLLLVLVGYFVSVMIGLVAVVILYMALSSLPGAPDYFAAMSMSPLVVIAVPPVALFIYLLTVVLTGAQTLVAAVMAELFELRSIFVHAMFGLLAAVTGFFLAWPTLLDGFEGSDWADLGIVAAAGLAGGICYWLIAGRNAGVRPRP